MTRSQTLPALRERHTAAERSAILDALEAHAWSLAGAARQLGVTSNNLQSAIRAHGLTETYSEHVGRRPRGRPRKVATE